MDGVAAGEVGSEVGSQYRWPCCSSTSLAHTWHTLWVQGSASGCLYISLHTGHTSSRSMFFMLVCGESGRVTCQWHNRAETRWDQHWGQDQHQGQDQNQGWDHH